MIRVLFIIILSLIANDAMAGDLNKECTVPQCCIATPNATAIARYGDIPMNYYTGRANISVPLYHTSQRGIDLDVSLSYDTQGIIATSLPGWTGHNWTLNAGGVITRVTNKMVDEYDYSPYNPSFRNYFSVPNKLPEYVNEYNKNNNSNNNNNDKTKYIDILVNHIMVDPFDCEPDVFYFNFMGKSGRFFYSHDGEWKVLSDDNICVVFDVTETNNYIYPYFKYFSYRNGSGNKQRKTIKGFTLIDENGTKYIFGDNSNSNNETSGMYETRASAIEYSQPFFSALRLNDTSDLTCESMRATAWYLTEVRDCYDNVLYRFEYERGKFLVQASYMDEDIWESFNGHTQPQSWSNFHYALCLNAPVYLSKITMPLSKEKIEFTVDNNRVLSKEDFYPHFTYNLNQLRKYAAKYDSADDIFYFLHGNETYVAPFQKTNNNKKQDPLSSMGMSPLKKVTLYSTSVHDKILESFELEYAQNTRLFLTGISISNGSVVKGRYDFEYNGANMLPKEYVMIDTDDWGYYSSANRTPDLTMTQYGMLKEIHYPTGGVSVISYDQNRYSSYFDRDYQVMRYENGTAGGLVVKSIVNYEDAQKQKMLSSKTYTYSGGQLYALPKHSWTWTPMRAYVQLHFSNYNSIVPLCNSFGPHIGYSTVKETNNDGTYSIYRYQNIESCMDEKPIITTSINSTSMPVSSPFDVFSERGYKRGKIVSIKNYDNRGNEMSGVSYYYRTDNVEKDYVYNTNITMKKATGQEGNAQATYYTGCIYKMFYPKYDVVKTLTTTRYDANIISDETDFDKEDVTLAVCGQQVAIRKTKSETVKRGSNKLRTEYVYPYNETGINNYLVSQFRLPVTSAKRYYNGVLLEGKKTSYGNSNNKLVPIYDIVFSNNQNVCDTVARYEAYSQTCRLMRMTDGHGVTHRYFWNSLDGLAAIVDNGSTHVGVATNATNSKNIVTSTQSSEVFGTSPTAITTCIYNERGLASSITSGNKQTINYGYDTFGRLVSVKDDQGKLMTTYGYQYKTGSGSSGLATDNVIAVGAANDVYSTTETIPSSMISGITSFSYLLNEKKVSLDYKVSSFASSASIQILSESGSYHGGSVLKPGQSGHLTLSVSNLSVGRYDVCLFVDGKKYDSKSIYIPY